MLSLSSPASSVVSFGHKLAPALKRLGIESVRDLLLYAPVRHEDFRLRTTIAQIRVGQRVVVSGTITHLATRRSWKKHMTLTECLVEDATGSLRLLWFRQPYIAHQLVVGEEVVASGTLRENQYGAALVSPTVEKVSKQELLHTSGFVAQYPLTKGLTHKQLRYLVRLALPLAKELEDWIPSHVLKEHHLYDLARAVVALHTPTTEEDRDGALRRFAFEQLFFLQCQAQYIRLRSAQKKAQPIPFDQEWFQKVVERLPFTLTQDQKKAVWAMTQDIGAAVPMNRLLNGDVGTGKTAVAALLLAQVAHSGFQGVLIAPTELLARQHFLKISQLLSGAGLTIALITRGQHMTATGGAHKDVNYQHLSRALLDGSVSVVIGTHALLSRRVRIPNTALVIVDEQHRFGVDQRRAMLTKELSGAKEIAPHHCSMTATPIPRTLALAYFGDFDLSILQEFPQGQRKVETRIISASDRSRVDDAIRTTVAKGEQVFVICPRIGESGSTARASVVKETQRLVTSFPEIRWGVLHGKLESAEQQEVMRDFIEHRLDGVIATTVVEVGVDIPNASLLVVEGAETFGLSQLHQLRGRIGRAGQQSQCLLVAGSDAKEPHERLKALVEWDDGWKLAEIDLSLRGPGALIGQEQSGESTITRVQLNNRELLQEAHEAAKKLMDTDPALEHSPLVKTKIVESILSRR